MKPISSETANAAVKLLEKEISKISRPSQPPLPTKRQEIIGDYVSQNLKQRQVRCVSLLLGTTVISTILYTIKTLTWFIEMNRTNYPDSLPWGENNRVSIIDPGKYHTRVIYVFLLTSLMWLSCLITLSLAIRIHPDKTGKGSIPNLRQASSLIFGLLVVVVFITGILVVGTATTHSASPMDWDDMTYQFYVPLGVYALFHLPLASLVFYNHFVHRLDYSQVHFPEWAY